MAEKMNDTPTLKEVVKLLHTAHFEFKSLKEANALAHFFAKLCPNSLLAEIGLAEIFVNAVEHGNLGITSEEKDALLLNNTWLEEIEQRLKLPEYSQKTVKVDFVRLENELQIKVHDEGNGFNWRALKRDKAYDVHDKHGRGIALANGLVFKDLIYSEKGNSVTCLISLK